MIKVKNLTKKYNEFKAISNLNFEIEEGEIVGLLGPNGAGKTTTMNILAGYIAPTRGSVIIDDKEVLENPNEYKKMIGYLPENPPLYEEMTVKEYLKFVCDLKKVPKVLKVHKIEDMLRTLRLEDVKNKLIQNLSKGYKQRVSLAQALIGDPKVLILDEPTNGLDPSQILEMRNLVKKLSFERTIIISSHILSEINAICDRVIIIDKGKIIAEDTPANLSKSVEGSNKVFLKVHGDSDTIFETFKQITSIIKLEIVQLRENDEHDFILIATSEKATEEMRKEVVAKLTSKNIDILEMKVYELSLEEIFLKYTNSYFKDEEKEEISENIDNSDNSESQEESLEKAKFLEDNLEDDIDEKINVENKTDKIEEKEAKQKDSSEIENKDKNETKLDEKQKKKEEDKEKKKKKIENREKKKEKDKKIENAKKEYNKQLDLKEKKEAIDKDFWGNDDEEEDE